MDLSRNTPPSDCGLAVAIPWNRAQFLAQFEPASSQEFARWYRVAHGGSYISPETLWDSVYRPAEATTITRCLEDCRKLGVEVTPECSLSSLVAMCERKRVVILVAHWRSGLLQLADLLDPTRFTSRLATERSGVPALLRERIQAAGASECLATAMHAPEDRVALTPLVEVLQTILASTQLQKPPGGLRETRVDAPYLTATNRRLLNAAFPDELAPGEGLELCDRTHSADEIATALESRFSGFMDMAVCNSYLLAEAIKRVNPDCLIMANRENTSPLARLLIARQVLKSLSRRRAHYAQVALDFRERLSRTGNTA